MPGTFDRIDAQHKPRKPEPIKLDPPKFGYTCAYCGAGQLEYVATTNVSFGLRCGACKKEPRRAATPSGSER